MWSPVLRPGLTLLSGARVPLRAFNQELAHFAAHDRPGCVLWLDGDHGMDPYHFAERNLEAGRAADEGADRVLVKRCMTPFQWDSVLTQHLQEKLIQTQASMVLAAPFDRLYSTDELKDWEQEDYVRFSLQRLRDTARRHKVPVLLAVDMDRWWHTHPVLAAMTYEAAQHKWSVTWPDRRFRLVEEGGQVLDPWLRRQVTLLDYSEEMVPVPVMTRARRRELEQPMWSWREHGRVVHLPA